MAMTRGIAVRLRRLPGSMNKTEDRYAALLGDRVLLGEVADWKFEPITFRLAKNTRYEPDFLVTLTNGEMEIHEVKGHWEDDARVKIKVAAEMFPQFRFVAVRFDKRSGWQYEQFN